jgi:hypothetical protein
VIGRALSQATLSMTRKKWKLEAITSAQATFRPIWPVEPSESARRLLQQLQDGL